jgi:hypothetical protein
LDFSWASLAGREALLGLDQFPGPTSVAIYRNVSKSLLAKAAKP